jgi:hypothetical protein
MEHPVSPAHPGDRAIRVRTRKTAHLATREQAEDQASRVHQVKRAPVGRPVNRDQLAKTRAIVEFVRTNRPAALTATLAAW